MNRPTIVCLFLSIPFQLVFGFERVSDYSYIGLRSCTNYPGFSFWSPYVDDQKQELYNERLLLPILKNLELSAQFNLKDYFEHEVGRLKALSVFVSLDKGYGRANRLVFMREIAYSFLRIIDRGVFFQQKELDQLFSLTVFSYDGNWQVGRHLTFLKMVILANAIAVYSNKNGCYPQKITDCPHVTEKDTLDAWGRRIAYTICKEKWQLYSSGPREQPQYYAFDEYIPAVEVGRGTMQTYGVYLSSTFSCKREKLFLNRCIPYVVNNISFECFLNSANVLTDVPQDNEIKEPRQGVYVSSRDLCLNIAERVFSERFGGVIMNECSPYVVLDQGESYLVRGTRNTDLGMIPVLEIIKTSGKIIRCSLVQQRR